MRRYLALAGLNVGPPCLWLPISGPFTAGPDGGNNEYIHLLAATTRMLRSPHLFISGAIIWARRMFSSIEISICSRSWSHSSHSCREENADEQSLMHLIHLFQQMSITGGESRRSRFDFNSRTKRRYIGHPPRLMREEAIMYRSANFWSGKL